MSKRKPNDFYPTPADLALAITQQVSQLIPKPAGVIEPSAGHGPFIRAAKQVWPDMITVGVDIDPAMYQPMLAAGADQAYIGDWKEVAEQGFVADVLLLGNPPFREAQEHIELCLAGLVDGGHLALLLRMSMLGSRGRVPFWEQNPARYLIPLVPRPSFTGGRSDNSEYGIFLWEAGYRDSTELLAPLVWK